MDKQWRREFKKVAIFRHAAGKISDKQNTSARSKFSFAFTLPPKWDFQL